MDRNSPDGRQVSAHALTADLFMLTMTTATLNPVAAVYQVLTTPPVKLADTQQSIEWSRRSTTANPVDTANRYRGVVVDRSTLAVPADACTSKFSRLLQSTVNDLAQAAFTAWAKENMSTPTIDANRLSLDSVLAFWAEEKQRQSIDGDKIKAWLPTSETFKPLNEKQRAAWLINVPKLAAPSYKQTTSKDTAAVIVGKIAEADSEHPVALFILQRCNNVLAAEADTSADAM